MFRFKHTLDKKTRSDLVYRCSYSSYNATYYGKIYRHFFTSAAEHMGISSLTGRRVKSLKKSTVFDHQLQCDCTTDFDHFDILASGTKSFKIAIKQSFLTESDKPVLNHTVKSFPLKRFN